jgi:trimethylamine--corrinoid protein Co-methyltransferase
MVLGVFLTTMNLRTGAPTFGTPEANLATYAVGQLVRRLDLPLRVGGHLTSSKVLDAQAAQESGDTMLVGLQAGANFVLQAAGWLEGGLVIGYEKFVFDLDRCGSLSRMLTGLVVDDNTLAADAFREAGVGTNFLGVDHTMANFETANYQSDLADDTSFEQWADAGSLDSAHRANLRWKEMLADYRPPPFDQAVDEALRDFMDSKKASDEDRWY